jgi:colanic acid biosynthesis glycosyl transferase WcaI
VEEVRINVISIYYWPEPTGIGPYATGTAEYLASAGDEVTAVVGMPHFPAWKTDDSRAAHTSETRGGVRIIRFPHFVPAKHNAAQRARYELSFFWSLVASRRLPKADVSVAIVPNLGAAFVARLRRRSCGPYGVIVQDVSSQAAMQSGTPGGSAASRIARMVEGAALRPAAFVGVVSPAFVSPVEAMGVSRDRIIDVPNWTHIGVPTRDRREVRAQQGWDDDTTVVLHAGNMGRKQALETVVDAARAADSRDARVVFVLMGDGNQRAHLQDYAHGVSRLQFEPPQPDDLFADVLAAADVLLVSERASVRDMSLPSKLTSYFSAGRPVVAAVPADGSTAAELDRSGAGVVVPAEDPESLLAAVLDLRRDLNRGRRLGAAGRSYSEANLRPAQTLKALRRAIHAAAGTRRAVAAQP